MTKKEKILVHQCLSNLVPLKSGFTLAEVLITLAIIGVVAALTIPNLIQNYQNKVLVTQLQTTISILDNGFRLMMANEGVDYIDHTRLYSIEDNSAQLTTRPTFAKYFKSEYIADENFTADYSLITKEQFGNGSNCIKFDNGGCEEYEQISLGFATVNNSEMPSGNPGRLANGVFIWTTDISPSSSDILTSLLYVDVNGKKGPNRKGYDIHKLGVKKDGHVVPMNLPGYNPSNGEYGLGTDEYSLESGTIGAKRIKDDGWKITY